MDLEHIDCIISEKQHYTAAAAAVDYAPIQTTVAAYDPTKERCIVSSTLDARTGGIA